MIRVGVFVTHPVQYHAPIWQALAATPGIELKVHYFSDQSVRGVVDPGFGVPVVWDTPLLSGYEYQFVTRSADLTRPWSVGLADARDVLKGERYDWVMIHGYTHRFERQIISAAKHLGVKVLMRGEFADHGTRGWLRRVLRDAYLRWFYSNVTAFCYIGANAKRHLLHRGISEDQLFFSPYSVDTDLFERQRLQFERASSRESLGLQNDVFVLLFSGKLIPRKQPLLILEALRRVRDRGRIALIIVGDGPQRELVMTQGKDILGDRFVFAGFVNQSQVGRYMAAADAFVLPSTYETWGLVVNEAMQFGLPVITSDTVGCHLDLILEAETGFTFPCGDANALASKIDYLLHHREQAQKMGQSARQRVLGFSTRASAKGIVDALNSRLPKKGRGDQ